MRKFLFLLIFMFIFLYSSGQKVIFLHHSTGDGVFKAGNVAQWIAEYNQRYSTSYQVSERAYPNDPYPWANYPYDYWNLWTNNQCDNDNPNIECIDKLTRDYDAIIFKHCFPGAGITEDEKNSCIHSSSRTIANYKLQYRALRSMMDSYPNNQFIVWTLVPLHRLATNAEEASRAKEFVEWVKTSWLTEDGKAHPNIHIFDYFGLAAQADSNLANGQVNCLKYEYELDHNDSNSHPNELANKVIGPMFAEFIVTVLKK